MHKVIDPYAYIATLQPTHTQFYKYVAPVSGHADGIARGISTGRSAFRLTYSRDRALSWNIYDEDDRLDTYLERLAQTYKNA